MTSLAILLTVYGRYNFLDEAVSSIAFQSREPDEVLVFTDNREIVKKVLDKYGVKAEVYQEPKLSLPVTYARVGEIAAADYILPLEDDDMFKPNKLEILEKYCKDYSLISTQLIS